MQDSYAVLRQAQLKNILALGAEKNRKLRLEREAKLAAAKLEQAAVKCGLHAVLIFYIVYTCIYI